MVAWEIASNLTEFISMLPPHIIEKIDGLIVILKAVGIAAIVYVIYVVIMGFLTFRRMRMMGRIEEKVESMDKKLSRLLKEKKKK